MSTTVTGINLGATGEAGLGRAWYNLNGGNTGVIGTGDFLVSQRGAGANASVDVASGACLIPDGSSPTYAYYGNSTATENVVITANASGNPRWDAIVEWVDTTAYGSSDNTGALKFAAVAGTPAASPVAPTDAEINSSIGTYRFHRIGEVYAPNGFTQIVNANNGTDGYIHDRRLIVQSADEVDRDYKALPERVFTGLQPATSANLISDISIGNCVVRGKRIRKDRTESHTYTASKDTYVDINSSAAFQYTAVTLGAAEPAVASNSIRLAKVVTSGTAITSVTDLRNLYAMKQAVCSASLTLTTGFQTVVGTSVTFEVSQVSMCTVWMAIDISPNLGTAGMNAGDLALAQVDLDGADKTPQTIWGCLTASSGRYTIGNVNRFVLSSGAHTMKMECSNNTGNRGQLNATHSHITYEIKPLPV